MRHSGLVTTACALRGTDARAMLGGRGGDGDSSGANGGNVRFLERFYGGPYADFIIDYGKPIVAFYVALFVPRQLDDDACCARKYGPVWARYCELVPYRMVPGLW